ncbi:MAG: DUF433 domain-containing protein [Bryobacteraceae bacterium]
MESLDTGDKASLDSYVDWTGCELVERVLGKVSGRPIVRGTRILADTIVQDAELGSPLEEIHENYPDLSLMAIQRLISFARSRGGRDLPGGF